MAETKTTTTKGRKPKAVAENTNQEDMSLVIAQMQEQMAKLQKQLEETKKEKEEAVGQNLDLQTLVDALKSNNGNNSNLNNLPNYVTVISLIPNTYNLSTENDGMGTCFTFEELGESKIISLSNVQKIMGISKYRKQAEEGYFYIVEDGVNEYFRLDNVSNTVEDIKNIVNLKSDDCVDKFVALDDKLKISLADKIALDMSEGKKVDRNKLDTILEKTGIDIEEKARNLKKIMNK